MKVFWSWQSDTPGRIGRHFIRDALRAAIEDLRQTDEVEEPIERELMDGLHLDHDRQGVTGSPRLLETILGKIEASVVFVGDVTPVARIPGSRTPGRARIAKRIMNPNVAIELGYALKALTEMNVLMVLNEHYGDRRHLPFDIQGNAGPISYRLAPDATAQDIKQEAAKLKAQFTVALGDFVKLTASVQAEAQCAHAPLRDMLQAAWWSAVQQRPLNMRPTLVSSPSVVVHVVPAATLEPIDLDPREVRSRIAPLRLFDDAQDGSDGRQWWSHGERQTPPGRPNPEAQWYGRLVASGVVEFECSIGARIDDDHAVLVKGTRIESYIVEAADHGIELARSLGLDGPYAVGVVLYGTEEVEVADPQGGRGRFKTPSLALPLTFAPAGAVRAGDHMRKAFDVMWMAAGFRQSPSFDRPEWKGYSAI